MEILSIKSIANIARSLAKEGMDMRTAIHSVAEEYGTDPHLIACELSRRGCIAKRKKAIAKKLALEIEHNKNFEEWQRGRIVLGAYAHEHEMKGPFEYTGNMDDY
jgi:hypothetical protein